MKSLIGEYCSRRRPGRDGSSLHSIPLRHFAIKVEGNSRSKHGRCVLCTTKKEREMIAAGGVKNVECG